MTGVPLARLLLRLVALGLALTPGLAAAQVSVEGRVDVGRAEYRVRQAGVLQPAAGMVFGAAIGLHIRNRFEVWGSALGGRLAATTPDGEDRDIADVRLVGSASVQPWLTLQGVVDARSYSTPLARQHWTTLRLGAEAYVPLAPEGMRGIVRAQWMPVASISGLPGPAVALAAGAGVEWRGSRFSAGAVYMLERYDFPGSAATKRLEELAVLQLWGTMRWR